MPRHTDLLSWFAAALDTSCPTITSNIRCSTCTVPQCIPVSTLTVPCGCATPLATTTVNHPCSEPCYSGCYSTDYILTQPACTTTTTPPCPVITETASPSSCPQSGTPCAEPACVELKTVVLPCSCVADLPLSTKTVTGPCCRTTCSTTTQVMYPPCATFVTSSSTSSGSGVSACPA